MLTGQANAETPPVYGASTYNWRVALASAPNAYVQTSQTTAASETFNDLTPGQLYNFESNAVGAAGTSNWSLAGQLKVI